MTPYGAYEPEQIPRRRKGTDIWFKLIRWFAVIGWLLMLAAIFIASIAKPESKNYFNKVAWSLRTTWDMELFRYFFYLMIFGICISAAGLAINLKRHRRKDDEYLLSLIILGLASIVGIAIYLFFF